MGEAFLLQSWYRRGSADNVSKLTGLLLTWTFNDRANNGHPNSETKQKHAKFKILKVGAAKVSDRAAVIKILLQQRRGVSLTLFTTLRVGFTETLLPFYIASEEVYPEPENRNHDESDGVPNQRNVA